MIYVQLSGPMSGLPDFNRKAFMDAERILDDADLDLFNPARLEPIDICDEQENWTFALAKCLEAMSYNIDHDRIILAQLPGWEQSPGAQIEHIAAKRLGYEIIAIEDLWGELL